jgi:hypothetical protein
MLGAIAFRLGGIPVKLETHGLEFAWNGAALDAVDLTPDFANNHSRFALLPANRFLSPIIADRVGGFSVRDAGEVIVCLAERGAKGL